MPQQTIDLHINPSDGTISEDLKQTIERAGDSDQPGTFLLNEAAWNPPKQASTGCRNTGIHHVGLRATNPAAAAEFYRDVLGMQIVGGSAPDHPIGATAFLSSRPDEESHEIALFANPAFAHVAFKVSHSPNCDPCTHASWRRISRSSSWPTTECPSPFILTTLTAT